VLLVMCAEAASEQQQQQQEMVTVSFIDFDDDDDDCVSVATERSKSTPQCYLSALLSLAADTTLDQVHTPRQGVSQ